MLKILDRYLLTELILPFLVGVAAFLVIMISNTLYMFADLIVKSGVDLKIVGVLLLYSLPAIIVVTLPVAFMFAVLRALGRLAKDSEMIALRACGISLGRVISPILLLALLISYIGYYINETVGPWTNHETVLISRDMYTKQPVRLLKANQFFQGTDNRFFYVDAIDKESEIMSGIFVFDQTKPGYPQVIRARRGTVDKSKFVLLKGTLQRFDEKGNVIYEMKFDRLDLQMSLNSETIFSNQKSVQEMSAGEAYSQLQAMKERGQDTRAQEVDFHVKFSLPLATFFAALIAAPIGARFSKMGSYFGIAISIALVFVWYVLFSLGKSLGSNGSLDPVLAAWIQNILFGVIGFVMLLRLRQN